jgi:hypothetical protein
LIRKIEGRSHSRTTDDGSVTSVDAAGDDFTAIRSWLGHVSLDTTNHYDEVNLETKRRAPEAVGVRSKAGKLPRWRRDRSVLNGSIHERLTRMTKLIT